MEEPKEGKSDTQAIERSRSRPAPLSGSVGERKEEPGREGSWGRGQEGKQESVGQSSDEEELVAGVPREKARALESQLGFVEADGHFDLPAPGISEDDLPGEVGSMSGLRGEEIPGGLAFASGND